jgi:hemerythrin-like metal-binding protein
MRELMDTVAGTGDELTFHTLDADVQHRRLSQLMQELSRAVTVPDGNAAEVLDRLTTFLEVHCADEEQFLEAHACPADLLAIHRTEHAAILARLMEGRESGVIDASFAQALEECMDSHGQGADRAYIEYFRRARGI